MNEPTPLTQNSDGQSQLNDANAQPVRLEPSVRARRGLRRVMNALCDPRFAGRRLGLLALVGSLALGVELVFPRAGLGGLSGAPGFFALAGLVGALALGFCTPPLRALMGDGSLRELGSKSGEGQTL